MIDSSHASSAAEAPTLQLSGRGDRCTACDAQLASDQRYCIACGERRGAPRFPATLPSASPPPLATPPRAPSRTGWASSGLALIAGVATLLVAMGVGVLIGHDSTAAKTRTVAAAAAPAPVSVHITGGGGAASTTPSRTRHHAAKKAGKAVPKAAKVSEKVAAKQNVAAQKVTGGSAKVGPSQVTPGQSGTGAGYQHHKFTGNFFGGG